MNEQRKQQRNEWALLAQQGDKQALASLCESFTTDVQRLAGSLLAKDTGGYSSLDVDDLAQVGYVSILEAVDLWCPSKAPFEPYVRNRLRHKLRKAVLGDSTYATGSNVAGAVRAVRAIEQSGAEADLDEIGRRWAVSTESLEAALAIDTEPLALLEAERASYASESLFPGFEPLLSASVLSETEKAFLMAVRQRGAVAVATELDCSVSRTRARFRTLVEKLSKGDT